MMIPVVFFLAFLAATTTAANTADRVEGDVAGFTAEQAQVLVDRHNYFRAQEDATSMIKVVWDEEIAASAQGMADTCTWTHMPWSERKLVGQYGGVGENLYGTGSESGFNTRDPVDLWAYEINYYHYDDMSCDEGEMCGHYEQVVWDSARAIGCGVKKCDNIIGWDRPGYVVFCQYGPPGNWDGQRPYDQGAKCSDCPDFAPNCDAEYNLCTAEEGTSNPNPPTGDSSEVGPTLECETGWTEIEGKCYKYYSMNVPFDDAVVACGQDGAIIAMPKTDAILQGLLDIKTDRWVWINVVVQQDTWYDGTPLAWTNWNDGEDVPRCVYIRLDTELWYYRDCTRDRKFFCEKEMTLSERRRRAVSDDDVVVL